MTSSTLIIDAADTDQGARCALPHVGPDGYTLPVQYEADYRLILSTADGLRHVDLCGDPQHDNATGDDLTRWSTASDPDVAALEAAVFEAMLSGRLVEDDDSD